MQATEGETCERASPFEAQETLVEGPEGALVHGTDALGAPAVAFVPASPVLAERELERLAFLRGPGIPEVAASAREGPDSPPSRAILLASMGAARPLHRWEALPTPSVRAAAVVLLSTLSHVHSKGLVHGAVRRDWILADGEGAFWIAGWSRARTQERGAEFGSTPDAAAGDLGDLGRALLRASLGSPWPDPAEMAPGEVREAASRIAATDRELARVLMRLATTDPREFYGGASEALSDLGATDLSLPEPWEEIPFVGRRRHVDAAMALLDLAGTPSERVASLDFVGGPGSGKTRLLREIAGAARARGAIVFTCEGLVGSQGFGALGALARQLAAHVPHDSPVRSRHAALLDRMLDGSKAPQRASADDEIGIVSPLVDLVRAATGDGAAVLAVDDVHLLPRTALDAWMALGRYVEAIGCTEGPLRLLLVTTAESVPTTEPGVRRERRELADWGRLHVHALLSQILTEPGSAAVLARDVHRLVGGRPREVVELLRHLEEEGALASSGRTWRWVEGQPTLEAPSIADRVRRGLEAAGRDGSALVEAIAAAEPLQLHREELAELAGVPGHRLHAAAESAVRAGLLTRHGSGWRVRAESVRRRVECSMTEERRRGLHREIVARLLDTRPNDLPALALHARRAADPRALEWTRAAAAALRAASRPVEAAEHLQEAIADCGLGTGPAGWRDLLAVADALVDAGLTAKAEAIADAVLADPRWPPACQPDALVVKARALRVDNRFYALTQIPVPGSHDNPVALARLRFYRAGALGMIQSFSEAERELRLAAAEVPKPEDSEAADYERLQALHLISYAADRPVDAHRYLVALLRHPRARANRCDQAHFLSARANLCRTYGDLRRAILWLHAARALTVRLGRPPALMSAIQNNLGIAALALGRTATAIRCFEHALALGIRAESAIGTTSARARLSLARSAVLDADPNDTKYVHRLADSISSIPPEELEVTWRLIMSVLLNWSLLPPLETLGECVLPQFAPQVRRYASKCRMALDGEPWTPPSPPPGSETHAATSFQFDLHRALQGTPFTPESLDMLGRIQPHVAVASAWALRRNANDDDAELISFVRRRLAWVKSAAALTDWHHTDLVATVLVTHGDRLPLSERRRLGSAVLTSRLAVPPAVQWRVHLAAALEHARAGRIAAARASLARSDRSIEALRRSEFGASGPAAASRASVLSQRVLSRVARLFAQPCEPVGTIVVQSAARPSGNRVTAILHDRWTSAMVKVCESNRAVVLSPHVRELEVFLDQVGAGIDNRVVYSASGAVTRTSPDPRAIFLLAPNLWPEAAARSALGRLMLASPDTLIVTLVTAWEEATRTQSPALSALLDLASGILIALPSATSDGPECAELMTALCMQDDTTLSVESDARLEFASYCWPGGLLEMENLVREIRCRGVRRVDGDVLDRLGWRERAVLAQATALGELSRQIVIRIGKEGSVAMRDLVLATGRPSRTVLRVLGELVASGRLLRVGKGRATRYRIGGRTP